MIKNKKGFTLIEILAAITILGILTGIAVVSVTKIIANAKEKHYITAEQNMVLAGQSYVQQNRANLPKAIGQKKKIPLSALTEKNYIQPIKDYSDNACDLEKSYVQIYKYSQKDYSYVAYLECPSYTSKENLNDITPEIELKIEEDADARTANAVIKITGNDKLVSYSYIIYRNNKEVKNTGNIQEKSLPATKNINFSLDEYTPGNLKIVVTATNIYGNTKTKTLTKTINDNKPPKCIIKQEDIDPKTWINTGSRKITVGCEDGETGSGCKREEFTKTFSASMRTGIITIEDENGNTTDCEVSVYIDKVNPTITVKAYKRTSAGGKTGSVLKSVSTTTSSTSGTIDLTSLSSTEWLNNANYPYGIYYELTFNDNLELNNYNIKRNATELTKNHASVNTINLTIISSELSGTSQTKKTVVSTDGYRKTIATITDAAGNSANVLMITPVDRTAPTVPTVSMYKWNDNSTTPTSASGLLTYTNDTWTNKHIFTIASGSTDAMSGFKEYQYTTTGETENNSNKAGTTRNIKAEGISYIKYRACDNAGNCSEYSNQSTIKIDKTKPTCSVTGGNAAWINASSNPGNRIITASCIDPLSGCATEPFSFTYSTNIKTRTAGAAGNGAGGTVYDNAGNSNTCAANQTVNIDKSAPSLSNITNSKDGVWTNGTVLITATANDPGDSGIAHVKYYYSTNGTRYNDWDSDSTKTNVKGTWSAERNQNLYLEVTDNAGNVTSGYSAGKIQIDKTAPVISSISNPKENTATIPGLQVTLTGADQGSYQSGLAKWKYKEGSGSWIDIANSNYSPYVDTFTALRDTTTFYYSLCDVAGNCSESKSTKVKIVDACSSTTTTWTGTWGTCSKTCGTGTQTMSGTKYSDYDGRNCGADSKSQNCNTQTCCSKTTTTWTGTWGTCSKTCGTGTQTMSGTKYSDYDGSNCGADSKSQNCNTQTCCSKTTTTWSGTWGECSKTCGTGTQSMSGIKYSDYDGSNCGADSKSQNCNTHSCEVSINTTKYSGCDSYYITTCTGDTCNYTQKNGRDATGTISYSSAVDTLSSSCTQSFCSASLSKADSTYTYYTINNCTIDSFGVTSGNGCSKGSKTSSNKFKINISSAPTSGRCPIWVTTNEPYRIDSGEIKYGASWNTYYCGGNKFCPNSGCSSWCVTN